MPWYRYYGIAHGYPIGVGTGFGLLPPTGSVTVDTCGVWVGWVWRKMKSWLLRNIKLLGNTRNAETEAALRSAYYIICCKFQQVPMESWIFPRKSQIINTNFIFIFLCHLCARFLTFCTNIKPKLPKTTDNIFYIWAASDFVQSMSISRSPTESAQFVQVSSYSFKHRETCIIWSDNNIR